MQLQKSSKKPKLVNLILAVLVFSGIVLIIGGWYLDYRKKVLSFYLNPVITESQPVIPRLSRPVGIKIPEVGISLGIQETKITDGIWEISEGSANYLAASARPGEGGNIIIYGHNKKHIFGNLISKAKIGQTIEILTENGKSYLYRIEEIMTVKPEDVEPVLPTDDEVLTLYTCSGILDSERLVLRALPSP